MIRRLSVAPRPFPGETIWSWVRRIAARHRLAPAELMDGLLPDRPRGWWGTGGSDRGDDPAADAALAAAAGLPHAAVTALRDPVAKLWSRDAPWPLWCQDCVRNDIRRHGETYERSVWRFGGFVLCPVHRRVPSASCPRCDGFECRPEEAGGRIRMFCERCGMFVDDARPRPGRSRLWPHDDPDSGSLPEHAIRGPAVIGEVACDVVLALQTDLFDAARGRQPVGWLSLGMSDRVPLEVVAGLIPFVRWVTHSDRSALLLKWQRSPQRWPLSRKDTFSALAGVGALLAEAAGDPRDNIVWDDGWSGPGAPGPVRFAKLFRPVKVQVGFSEERRSRFRFLAKTQRALLEDLAHRAGGPFAEAVRAELSTVAATMRLARTTDGRRAPVLAPHEALLRSLVAAKPGITLREVQAELRLRGVEVVSLWTISHALVRTGLRPKRSREGRLRGTRSP